MLYLGIFVFGKHIPLPFAKLQTGQVNPLLVATGGDSSQASLFSLGISPWMSAMIIIGMLAQLRLPMMSKMTEQKMDVGQKALTFFLTVIQVAVMLREFQLTDNSFGSRLAAGLFLMAGSFLLIWLSVENDKNGLGGISLILMANMFFTLMKSFANGLIPGLSAQSANIVRALALFVILLLGAVTVILTNAERRVPVTKLLISSMSESQSTSEFLSTSASQSATQIPNVGNTPFVPTIPAANTPAANTLAATPAGTNAATPAAAATTAGTTTVQGIAATTNGTTNAGTTTTNAGNTSNTPAQNSTSTSVDSVTADGSEGSETASVGNSESTNAEYQASVSASISQSELEILQMSASELASMSDPTSAEQSVVTSVSNSASAVTSESTFNSGVANSQSNS